MENTSSKSLVEYQASAVATAADSTTETSVGSQEVGDANEPVGVEVAATTAGEADNLIVMDVLGVSMAPGEDEGQDGGRGQEAPQERTPCQLQRDTHIRSAGNQRFRREQWNNNGGVGQARRAEHNHQAEQLNNSHAYYQDADDYAAFLSDDDAYHSGSSDDFPSSP
jgi:hypothetical protein